MLASDSPMSDGGTACVRIDITANKSAEAELRKLSRAVEQSPASVIITGTDGIISYVNPKFTETTGYTAKEAIGKRPNMVSSGEDRKSTRLNSSHRCISYAVFCLKKKNKKTTESITLGWRQACAVNTTTHQHE